MKNTIKIVEINIRDIPTLKYYQIQSLNTNPIEILASPGLGKAIKILPMVTKTKIKNKWKHS